MNTKSLEAVHVVDYLPNKYAVTDKADGDRCLGIIISGKLYLIFTLNILIRIIQNWQFFKLINW